MKHIHVESAEAALREVDRLMPTDYMKDDILSERAGYPSYFSTMEGCEARWNDLGCRYEVILKDEIYTIWIDDIKDRLMKELAELTKKMYPNMAIA